MKTTDQIYNERIHEDDTTEGLFLVPVFEITLQDEIKQAMQEYAYQFQSQLSEKDREIEQARQKSQRLFTAAKLFLENPFSATLQWELEDSIKQYNQPHPGDSGTKQDKK